MASPSIRLVSGLLLATAGAGLAAAAPREGLNEVMLRGRMVAIYYHGHSAAGPSMGKVIFAPGDAGWRGAAVNMAQAVASWGYDVFGLDTKVYLEAFTGKTTLQTGDVARDFYSLAAWAAPQPAERVALLGWSEGAGLVVLAASSPAFQSKYLGVVTLGLSDSNVIGWRWQDDLTYLTKRPPDEPTFSCLELIPRVAPLRVAMLQSSRDEYVPAQESRQLFSAARDPKRYFLIEAQNHRFEGNIREFNQRLKESLQWVSQEVT